MPIYEYECSNCNHQFEMLQKISEEPIKQCPSCYQDAAIRLVSSADFRLVGTGWYATDYKTTKKDVKSEANKDKE